VAERPALAERLALLPNVIAVADAMAYAHSKGLVHRDLKPANVLVGAFGETVIIDWGIAKALSTGGDLEISGAVAVGTNAEGVTAAGAVLGTPAYMPPEQAAGGEVDQRADVFALGAVLYEVLAGRPPHDTSTPDVMRRVLAGHWRPLPEGEVAADLSTIVKKAMAPDPRDRYPSARELADDLRRFQTGQLVSSHQYSVWALAKRWVERHRALVLLAGVLGTALVVVGAVGIARVLEARVAAEAAQKKAERATHVAEARTNELLLAQARALVEGDPTAALAVLKTYPSSGENLEGASALASQAWSNGVARHVLGAGGEAKNVVFSPDGRWVAAGGMDAKVHVWDTATGAERTFAGHTGPVSLLVAAPDGRLLVSSSGAELRVWDLVSGAGRALEGHALSVRWMGFSAGGALITSSKDKTIRRWELASGESRVLVSTAATGDIGRVAVSRDGRRVAYGGTHATHLIDGESGEAIPLPGLDAGTGSLAFSADGRRLVAGGMDGKVRVWDLASGKMQLLLGHVSWVERVSLSPDGTTLMTTAGEGAAWSWDLATGQGRPFPVGVGSVSAAAYSPDGSLFAMAGDDRVVRVWELPSRSLRVLHGHSAPIAALAFAPDGRSLASASLDKTVRVWDLASAGLHAIRADEGDTMGFLFSVRGDTVALYRNSARESVLVADVRSGRARRLGDGDKPVPPAGQVTADGAPIGEEDAALRSYFSDGGFCARAGTRGINSCAYAPDGKRIAVGTFSDSVRVSDPVTGAFSKIGDTAASVLAVTFSPDSARLAYGSADHLVHVYDFARGTDLSLAGHTGDVESVAFSYDGAKLASASMDGSLRVWNLATKEARTYDGDQLAARSVAFSRDDRFALVGDRSGSVRLWDLASGRARIVRQHPGEVLSIGVSPDGHTVLSNGNDGSSWLWDLRTVPSFTLDAEGLRHWMDDVTTAQVSGPGEVLTPKIER
ncbi:MAG TPA: serine/threonine-protein kinase, partial [Polyangiaceae bacterium]